MLRRISALMLVVGLMLVPAVGRAKQRVDPPNAKRLSAPYRSVDVRPAPILIAPDTSTAARADVDPDTAVSTWTSPTARRCPQRLTSPTADSLRGPPRR